MGNSISIAIKSFPSIESAISPCLVIPIFGKDSAATLTSKYAKALNTVCKGNIQALLKRGDISNSLDSVLLLPTVDNIKSERILLVGCGTGKNLNEGDFIKIVDKLLKQLTTMNIKEAIVAMEELSVKDRTMAWMVEQISIKAGLITYSYSQTISKPKPAASLKKLTLALTPTKLLSKAAKEGQSIASGMNVARELGNLPGNICTPSYLANQAKALARKYPSLSASIVEEKKMRELGMESFLSVTAGSDQPAKLIILEYKGANKNTKPHVLVGKGITFDSGGISLKGGAGMDEMKFDMCGAASVFGAINAIAELKLAINVVAVVAAAENMPSSNATKPGDVITSMSGQTIEILNTDAEGRLVLCDALTYAERFKPQSIIDIATLTGACVVALGKHASALYSNQDDFAEVLLAAGKEVGDKAWHMPLWDEYQTQLHSNFADIANIGGPGGGSITAACFLSRFAKNMRWAHLDIAGTAWDSGANKGATGRPVALLTKYLIHQSK